MNSLKTPHVFLIAAITADGKIAHDDQQVSTAWTSAADKKWFHQRTKEARVMVMGSKTYATVGRPLPGRLTVVMTSKAKSEWSVEKADQSGEPSLVLTSLSPAKVVEKLTKLKYPEIAICGGSSIYTAFAQAGLLQTAYLTLEPHLFGSGSNLFNEYVDLELALIEVVKMEESDTLLLTYRVKTGKV